MPPLVVETKQTNVKKPAKKSAPVSNTPAPTIVAPEPQKQQETAYGPVDGYAASRSATGTKTDAPLIEIPQSISVITRDQMDDRNVQILNDALRYTAGVQAGDTADFTQETFSIRGFNTPYQAVYRDGLREMFRGFDSVTETYGLERVEVLKGPASVLYGQGMPGGIVNLVTKRPTETDLREVQLQVGSFDRYQAAFDFSGKAVNTDNVLYRLTFMGRESDTQIDYVEDDRVYFAPALTFRSDSRDTTLTVLSSYQRDDTSFIDGLPAYGTVLYNPNGKIPSNRFTGEPDWSNFERESYAIGYILDHKVSDALSLHQSARFATSSYDRAQLLNRELLPDMATIRRRAIQGHQESDRFTVDSRAEYKFELASTKHDLIAGIDYTKAFLRTETYRGEIPGGLNIFNPVYGSPIVATGPWINDKQTGEQTGLYLQDQIKLWKGLTVTAGLRKDWANYEAEDFPPDLALEPSQKREATTYRLGAIYELPFGLAPYVSYAESFVPVFDRDFTNYPTEPARFFEPETAQQYEVGVKFQPKGGESFITLAAYDLTRQNALTYDPSADVTNQTGEIRTKGIEVEAVGAVTKELNVIATYTYNDAEVTKSIDEDELGKRPYAVAEHMASFWGNYAFKSGPLDGLSLGAGVRYVGNTPGDLGNTFFVPSYTLADGAIRYDYQGALLSLNVNNVFDKEYVSVCYSDNSCYYGNRRSVIGSVTYKW